MSFRPSRTHLRLRSLVLVALSMSLACGTPTSAPNITGRVALLATMEGDPLTLLDVDGERVISRPISGLGVFGEDASARTLGGGAMVFSGAGKLIGFDMRSVSIAWQEELGASTVSRFGGQIVYGNYALAFTPDDAHLLVADALLQDTSGVAVLDSRTRNPEAFVGPLRVRRMLPIAPGVMSPSGGVLALGTRAEALSSSDLPRRRGQLFLIAGTPLAVRDSLSILLPADSVAGGVVEMALAPDGRSLYYITFGRRLYKYDLVARHHVAMLSIPTYGPLAVSAASGSVYIIDGTSTREDPGSGMMYIVDADLTSARPIDLRSATTGGQAPVLNTVVCDETSGLVYVGTGTPSRGPIFGTQRGTVIVVDPESQTVQRVIRLDSWGVRAIRFL